MLVCAGLFPVCAVRQHSCSATCHYSHAAMLRAVCTRDPLGKTLITAEQDIVSHSRHGQYTSHGSIRRMVQLDTQQSAAQQSRVQAGARTFCSTVNPYCTKRPAQGQEQEGVRRRNRAHGQADGAAPSTHRPAARQAATRHRQTLSSTPPSAAAFNKWTGSDSREG
jgi:hypothetical protein